MNMIPDFGKIKVERKIYDPICKIISDRIKNKTFILELCIFNALK